ncbi:SgrR family transcriptional regulator [Xenophilus sp. AP218F]|nr:SgrR family transcriptional regulator [Xenophilus sp. AP218F]
MPSPRLTQQYHRLLRHYGGQNCETSLQQLADVLVCTRRHMRALLAQMQAAGWIAWQAQPGRGMRSRLAFLKREDDLRAEQAEALLTAGRLEQVLGLLADDRQALTRLLRSRLGQHADRERQILGVPYYRAFPNLDPSKPLRRSEQHLARQIFNGLTVINEEKGEVVGDLAHHWRQISPCEWHFHLRPAVRWHDGRPLGVADICATLARLRAQPLFAHLRAARPLSSRSLAIELAEPDCWLPWLLADVAALILPADHAERADFASQPIGSGPYLVAANNAYRLSLHAFDDYFGFRALLDEVNIWMMPEWDPAALQEDSQPCVMRVQLASQPDAPPGAPPSDMVVEQGGFFALCDSRSPRMRDPALRAWLARIAAPLALAGQMPAEVCRYWIPANGLLPGWHHRPVDDDAPPFAPPPALRLAYYRQQPVYAQLAQAMATCLARHGVALRCEAISHAEWAQGQGEFDLWLGSINFSTRAEYAVPAWLLGTPLLRATLPDAAEPSLADWRARWRRGEAVAAPLSSLLTRQRWLLPLFHGWLQLQGPGRMQGLHLNQLGWFDFKSAWLEPGETT